MGPSVCDAQSPQHDLHDPSWSDFEGAELTWVDGQPRVVCSGITGEKVAYGSGGGGTLQSLVDQASGTLFDCIQYDLVKWLDEREGAPTVKPHPLGDEQLVPAIPVREEPSSKGIDDCELGKRKRGEGEAAASSSRGGGTGLTISTSSDEDPALVDKAHKPLNQEADDANKDQRNARKRPLSTKRRRIASVHNQSEKRRREKFNHKIKALQKLLPRSSKNDKVSILDDVISYMQKLQNQMQMQMMSSFPHMLMPMMSMQQLQMAMMAQMNLMTQMGMAMGANPIAQPLPPSLFRPHVFPSFAGSWDSNITDMASNFTINNSMQPRAQEQISNNISRTESSALPNITDGDSIRQ